jgi:beta-xylosidase
MQFSFYATLPLPLARLTTMFSWLYFFTALMLASIVAGDTYTNPALSGWHSDPSCVFVPEYDNTTFCTASSFLSTPGLPIMASKDLRNWKLVGHALTKPEEIPEFDESLAQSDGIWAATIRYHQGTFYIVTVYTHTTTTAGRTRFGLILQTTNPYDDDAWKAPIRYQPDYIDPDIFWDCDGKAYITSAGTYLQEVDLRNGSLSEPLSIWNGSQGVFLEGPHIYFKDDFYYLLVAEGGSGLNHSVTIARSRNITGPYEDNPSNPVLTNRNTTEYFQNIGHADLFQDAHGNWWSAALAWRSGPEATSYPMGRETVFTPVEWPSGGWPTFAPVRGIEQGHKLRQSLHVEGDGPFIARPDDVDFTPGSKLPRNFIYWHWPQKTAYVVSPPDHPGTLQLTPSSFSITDGYENITAGYDIGHRTLVARKQTDTLFQYSVDIKFAPKAANEEVGVTAYLNQVQNHALGIVNMQMNASINATAGQQSALYFRFITSSKGSLESLDKTLVLVPVPEEWKQSPIRLYIQAQNETHYTFSAASTKKISDKRVIALGEASTLIGGQGDFTGAYRTTCLLLFAFLSSSHFHFR